jgi:hypothetical protein
MPLNYFLDDHCKKRIKPQLLRDVKTEALLVFARTALERYFERLDEADYKPTVGTDEDSIYIYDTLNSLKDELQSCVVNVDYLINLSKGVQKHPELKQLHQQESPLIAYYDVMARKVATFYEDKPAYIPEFLVICVLSDWIDEEEKSVELYPFLKDVDFLELISADHNKTQREKIQIKYGTSLKNTKEEVELRIYLKSMIFQYVMRTLVLCNRLNYS